MPYGIGEMKKRIRPWEEWKKSNNTEMLDMLENMPYEEQGLFMSFFFIEDNGYIMVPESTFVEFQETIIKYYSKWKELKDKNELGKRAI